VAKLIYPNRIIAIDFETTSHNPVYDYIVEIGAALIHDGVTVDTFQRHIQPNPQKFKINSEALTVQIGEIVDDAGDVMPDAAERIAQWFTNKLSAPTSRVVAEDFVKWCQSIGASSIPVVAHNAGFDHGFYHNWRFQQQARFKDGALSPVWIDTQEMARIIAPGGPQLGYGLDALCVMLGIEKRTGGHDALQDAILCGQVYFKLRDLLEVQA